MNAFKNQNTNNKGAQNTQSFNENGIGYRIPPKNNICDGYGEYSEYILNQYKKSIGYNPSSSNLNEDRLYIVFIFANNYLFALICNAKNLQNLYQLYETISDIRIFYYQIKSEILKKDKKFYQDRYNGFDGKKYNFTGLSETIKRIINRKDDKIESNMLIKIAFKEDGQVSWYKDQAYRLYLKNKKIYGLDVDKIENSHDAIQFRSEGNFIQMNINQIDQLDRERDMATFELYGECYKLGPEIFQYLQKCSNEIFQNNTQMMYSNDIQNAISNYESFNKLPTGSSTLEQVFKSSAGVDGWANPTLTSDDNRSDRRDNRRDNHKDDNRDDSKIKNVRFKNNLSAGKKENENEKLRKKVISSNTTNNVQIKQNLNVSSTSYSNDRVEKLIENYKEVKKMNELLKGAVRKVNLALKNKSDFELIMSTENENLKSIIKTLRSELKTKSDNEKKKIQEYENNIKELKNELNLVFERQKELEGQRVLQQAHKSDNLDVLLNDNMEECEELLSESDLMCNNNEIVNNNQKNQKNVINSILHKSNNDEDDGFDENDGILHKSNNGEDEKKRRELLNLELMNKVQTISGDSDDNDGSNNIEKKIEDSKKKNKDEAINNETSIMDDTLFEGKIIHLDNDNYILEKDDNGHVEFSWIGTKPTKVKSSTSAYFEQENKGFNQIKKHPESDDFSNDGEEDENINSKHFVSNVKNGFRKLFKTNKKAKGSNLNRGRLKNLKE